MTLHSFLFYLEQVTTDIPKCFISYCWSNSHDAIAKGSKMVEGALGWEKGDPRKVKAFLEEKGIKCWIDVEQVGGVSPISVLSDMKFEGSLSSDTCI